jgi:hypothetical protein
MARTTKPKKTITPLLPGDTSTNPRTIAGVVQWQNGSFPSWAT